MLSVRNLPRICLLRLFQEASNAPAVLVPNSRSFSVSAPVCSKKNQRKYPKTIMDIPKHLLPMFEGKMEYEYPAGLAGYGVRPPGFKSAADGKFYVVPEMIPELVVPDLTGFKLKPYVSYKVPDINEPEMSARDLFDAVYGRQLKADFDQGKLTEAIAEVEEREKLGTLTTHTYDREPPMMLDTSKVPVV